MKRTRMLLTTVLVASVACGDDPVTPPSPDRGITGTWSGQVVPMGTSCPMTQSVTEVAGVVTGTGTLGAPCSVISFTLAGTNNTGGVADSTEVTWTSEAGPTEEPIVLVLSGVFDGTDTMTGEVTTGSCTPGLCPYTFTRTSTTPVQSPTNVRREGVPHIKDPSLPGN